MQKFSIKTERLNFTEGWETTEKEMLEDDADPMLDEDADPDDRDPLRSMLDIQDKNLRAKKVDRVIHAIAQHDD